MRLRSLVTGGAGFVGSHLCDRLLEDGHDVVALDNFFTGTTRNVAHLNDNPLFQLVEHDVIQPLPDLGHFDRIFNLACPASPVHYQSAPIQTTLSSINGALHALRLAEARGGRVIQASTSEVYGDPEVHPQPESYHGSVNPIGPRACYDEGKRAAETLCSDFQRAGVDVRIARIFNTYGPRMAVGDGRVVSNFVVQAMDGKPLTVYGDGQQTRSFCYVSDLVEGLVLLADHDDVLGPVNLGNDTEVTMLTLAHMVIETTSSTSGVSHLPLPADDPSRRRPDLTLARQTLGYGPSVPLAMGLRWTADFFRSTR